MRAAIMPTLRLVPMKMSALTDQSIGDTTRAAISVTAIVARVAIKNRVEAKYAAKTAGQRKKNGVVPKSSAVASMPLMVKTAAITPAFMRPLLGGSTAIRVPITVSTTDSAS